MSPNVKLMISLGKKVVTRLGATLRSSLAGGKWVSIYMPDIHHALQIAAAAEMVRPLVTQKPPAEVEWVCEWGNEWIGTRSAVSGRRSGLLTRNRYPDLDDAGPGLRVEILAVDLKLRRLDEGMSRRCRPFVVDSIPGFADLRDVIPMREYSIVLRRDRQVCQVRRERRTFGYFDSAHIVKISCAVKVEADAVRCPSDLPWNFSQMGSETLPLRGDAFNVFVAIARG